MTNPFIDLFRENAQRKPAQNPFTQVFAEPDTGESPERLAALSRNPIAPPAVMGEAAKLGRLFDLPADVVARNIDEVRSGAADPMANWRRLTEDAPKTAAWMQDPINHSLASDNVEPLSRLERLIGRYSLLPRMGAVQVGNVPMPLTQFQQTAPGLPQQEFRQARETQSARGALALIPRGLRTEAQQMQLDGLTARQQEELSPSQSVVESFAREAAKILPSYVAMAEGAAVGTAVVGLAAVAGAPIALTLGTAASIGAFGNIFLMEAGNAVADFENVRDEQGRRIGNDGTAYALGLTYGVASTALERVGFGFVADPFMVAGKRFIAPAMTTALTAPTMRTALFEGAKAYGAAIVGETVTETLQTGLQLIGENDYRTLARWGGADVRGVTADDALDALKETAVSTAMGMAVLGVPGAGLRSASELGAATEAVARRDRLASAFEIAIPDAVRERDPERFRELVRASAEGQSVYIDAARATILLQEANLSPEEFTAAAGISMQDWNQATAAGTDLAIPVASLITDLAPTPLGEMMLPDLSYSLGGMTAREAEGMLKDAEAFKERVRKEAEAVGTIEESDPAYRIVDDLRAKLEAAGRTPAVAMVEAQAAAKPYIVWAKAIASKNPENPMADPWTLYSRKGGLGIIGGERAEATFDAVMAVSAARKRGAPAEEIAALESRVQRLADERVQIRAVLEEADQLLDVRDEEGRLRSSLRNVSTDALVIEFIRLRDIVQNADAELSSLEARQEAASAGANTATAEEQVGVLSEAGIEVGEMGNVETWAGKLAAYQRYLRSLRSQVRKVERSVPRLMRELEARGVTAPDLYARENQLGGTFVVPTDIPFQRGIDSVALLMQAAFHGTPHTVDKFLLSKIGTGEGAQAFGWGLYFAEAMDVAEGYRKKLSENVFIYDGVPIPLTNEAAPLRTAAQLLFEANGDKQKALRDAQLYSFRDEITQEINRLDPAKISGGGNLYRVDIADEAVATYLDWDKPLSEQAPEVIAALATLGFVPAPDAAQRLAAARATGNEIDALVEEQGTSGEAIYRQLSNSFRTSRFAVEKQDGADKQASLALLAAGIRGIKYLDAGSRGQGEGSRNLVVFDESDVTITHRNGEPVTAQERTDFLAQEGMQETLGDTIDVDGVSRPTTNSTGQPIHPTAEGVRNFWRWFGESKVVDAKGRPLVVYHGTDAADFGEFSGPTYWSTSASESSAYANVSQLAQRQRLRDKWIPVQANGSLDGVKVNYAGIISDAKENGKVGDVWATDNGVIRIREGGKIEVFTDVVVDPNSPFDVDAYYANEPSQTLATGASDAYDIIAADNEEFIASNMSRGEGGRVYAAYLKIANPMPLGAYGSDRSGNAFSSRLFSPEIVERNVAEVREQGYDGVQTESDEAALFPEVQEGLGGIPTQYVTFSGEQVKSALGNSGAFGPSADILMQEPLGAAVTTGDLGTMNVVRGTRVTADNVVLSKEEEQAVVAAVKEIKRLLPKMKPAMTKQDVAQYVREVKAAFPESDGWAPLEFKGIDPSQTNKDNNGKIEYKWGNVSYSFNRALDATQGLKVGTPEYEAQVTATANALVDEVRSVVARAANGDVAAKRIIAQRGWYKNMRQRLRQEFGGLGDVFADLLGALSPNTPVRENWKNAVDFLRRATEGAFDELIPQWEAWSAKVAQEEIAFKAWFDQQLVDRQMSATKFRNTPEWKARKAEMSAIRELPAALIPTKANGKKYGFNGKNAVRATLNLWRVVREADVNIGRGGQAPKALNFSGNLIGFRAKATIDVWAARMLQRLTGRVRVPPPAEQGVGGEMQSDGSTTGAFGYGQEVFARAAEAIRTDESLGMPDMGDDDLQAVVWFVEKELWTKNNWTSAAGEGGSFEFEADLQGVADVTRVDDLRRVMDSSKSTPEQREEAAAELTKLARTVDRYTVGLSIQQSGGIQGVDVIPSDDAQSVVLQGLRAAIYATTNPESVLATKAVSTEGRYFGEVERAVDVEAVVREGFDPTPLWREIVRVAQANNQDSAFLSRVLRAEETMDPTRHRPGIELYLSTTDTTVLEERIAAITAMLVAQDINGFTITMDGGATGTVEGQPGRPIGVRLQYVPEFDRRYSAEVQGLTEEQIAAKLKERGQVMADLADKFAAEVPDVSFAGRFFYETRVAFSHQYAEELADGTDDAVAGSEGRTGGAARRWEGRLLDEGIAATDRQLGIARADAERQAQSRDATGRDTSGPEGVALLEQRTGNRPNAYFLRTERVIGLMAGTNLSSVMHEMSHEYLATLEAVVSDPDVPEWLKQDFEVAVQAIGIEAGERDAFVQYLRTGLASDQKTLNRFVAAEEKWARSFESYLEKGEAPSRDLLRAFATFRVWFGQVYRALRQMLIPVSPELRGVFDRMLATDEEIAEYRSFPEATPLFMERPEGMTDAQWTEYTKGFRTRDALAGAALVKRILSETRAVVSQDWENKKAEVEASIREELAFDPLVQAVEFLRVGTDGEPMKLDRALLNVIAPDLWKSFPKGTTAADGVMTLDAVALKYGFPDALSLATALQGYQEVKDVVAKRLAETFRREYGDLLGDSTAMAEAVSEATHKAETDEPLVRELKALGQQLGMRVVDKPALVQLAREMLAKMRVSDIQPSKYELAEAREARASEAALRKGNTEQAAFHKRRQLLNRILVRESRTAVAEVEKVRAFALRMSKDPAQSTLGKAGESFTDAMNAVLAEYEFARVSRRQIGRREALDLYVKDVEARGGVPMLSDAIRKDASLVNYRALPLEELAAVDAAMRQIWHHAKTVNTIASEGRKISLEQAAEEIAVSLEKHRPQVEMNTDGTPISLGKSKELVQAIDAWHLPPTFLFRWLDGDNYGATWRLFFEPIQAAENAELTRLREASKRVTEIEKMVDFPPFLLDVGKSYDGIRSKLTRRQLLALAMNWGNASSRKTVLEAKTGDGYPQFGSAAAIEAMFAQALTEQDWKYVQARWDYANEFWPEIADLERRMTGIVPDKIEAAPFMIATKDGKTVAVRGGYYPLSYDRKLGLGKGLAKMGKDEVETDLGSLAFVGGARAQTKHGWTNERVGSAEKPIDLSLGVWNRHIQSVIHDLTHREAVRDVYALWQREDVRVALVRASGQEYYDSIKAWLVRVANPMATVGDSSYLEKVLQLARVGTTTVNLGLKFSSGVAQTLGYVQSLEAIGPKWMSVGMGEFMPDMARAMRGQSTPAIDFVMASSPMMANRKFNYNRDVADYARSKFGKLTDLDAFNFWFIGTMDGMVSFPTWIGAYRKTMAANGNDHDAAVRVADDTVESSQGAGAAKDLARIQGGTELRKLMTMHYTAFSRMFGQFRRATTNRAMGKYGTPRFLAAMTALWFGQVVLGELLGGRWPDDDEEPAQFWLWKIMSFPASFFIGIRDVVNALGPNAYGYKLTPAEAAFERTTKAANAVYRETLGDLFHGADREMTEAEARALVEAPGYWFRLPTKAIWQYGDYLMDWAQGEIAPANPVEMMRGLLMNQRPE